MNNSRSKALTRVKKVFQTYHGPSKSALKDHNSVNWQDILKNRSVSKNKLGENTSYGSVYELGTDKRYVIKRMKLDPDDPDQLYIFQNEVRVGTTPGIERVGPKIHAWRKRGNVAEYIMDNVLLGDDSLVSQSLWHYIQEYHPTEDAQVFKKLKTMLRNFWIITNGYHGDLHTGNIAVVSKPNGTVVRVMIYDYGSHKKIKVRLSQRMSFENVTKAINANFARSMSKHPNRVSKYPGGSTFSTNLYTPNTGQARRPNTNVLKTTNYRTGLFMTRLGQTSMMHVLQPPKRASRFTIFQ
jgi:hypothetical protein